MGSENKEAAVQELVQELSKNVERGVEGFDEAAAVGTMAKIGDILGPNDGPEKHPYASQAATVKSCLADAFGEEFADKIIFESDEDFLYHLEVFMGYLDTFRDLEKRGDWQDGDERGRFLGLLEGAKQSVQDRLLRLGRQALREDRATMGDIPEKEQYAKQKAAFDRFFGNIAERVKVIDTDPVVKATRLRVFRENRPNG